MRGTRKGPTMQNTKNTYKCYVTGSTEVDPLFNSYYFGSARHVLTTLTQMAFSYFNIRAEKDQVHTQIMADMKAKHEEMEAFKKKIEEQDKREPLTDDQFFDASIQLNIYADEYQALITQKAESGLRILRKMREDYQKNGKLTV